MWEDYGHFSTMLWGIQNIGQHKWVTQKAPLDEEGISAIDKQLHEIKNHQRAFCYWRAVAFELIMIGEAASQTSESTKIAIPSIPWRGIIDTRNRLAHAPWDLDTKFLIDIVMNYLPPLEEQITSVFKQFQN